MPENGQEITYESTYTQRLDDKRRVPVPHRWRSGKSEDFHLVIWPKHQAGTCLRAMSPASMALFRQKLNTMADEDPRKPLLKRQIGSSTITVTIDNAGRIAIPEDMAKAADISSEATFVGMFDRFEIWNPERYREAQRLDNAQLQEALKMLE